MRRLAATALAVLALAMLALAPPAPAGEPLIMAVSYGPDNFHTKGALRLAQLAEAHSNGALAIRVVPRQDLHLTAQALPGAVAQGRPPMADVFMAEAGALSPVFGMSSLPMLVNTFDQAREMFELMRPVYESVADFQNLKLLYAAPWPPSGVFAMGPVTAESFGKQHLRVYDANSAAFFQSLGAKAQIMDLGEVPFAQRNGRLDMALTSSQSAMEHRFTDFFSHFTRLGYAYPLNMAVMNMVTWHKLDPTVQAALTRAASEVEAEQWQAARADDETATAFLASRGMTVVEPDDDTLRVFQAAAVPMIRTYLSETGDDTRRAWDAWRKGRAR